MKYTTILAVALALLPNAALGHMHLQKPSPIAQENNPFITEEGKDYDMDAPLNSQAPYPCRGHLKQLHSKAGNIVATWAAGSTQTLTIAGDTNHRGGSCQVSLSYDEGKTFTVIKSFIGGCPLAKNYKFTIPADAPSADKAVFAWTWFNLEGNREMYMNCAAVKITGGKGGSGWSSRPQIFKANIAEAGSCKTTEGKEVVFPNPGPDVEGSTSKPDPLPGCNAKSQKSSSSSSSSSNPSKRGTKPAKKASKTKKAQPKKETNKNSCSKHYTVADGDICFDLAEKASLSLDELIGLNPGLDCDDLEIGQVMCVSK